ADGSALACTASPHKQPQPRGMRSLRHGTVESCCRVVAMSGLPACRRSSNRWSSLQLQLLKLKRPAVASRLLLCLRLLSHFSTVQLALFAYLISSVGLRCRIIVCPSSLLPCGTSVTKID